MRCRSIVIGILALSAGLALANDAKVIFDIPSQPLVAALRQFADQAGVELAYESRLAEGRTSLPVKGEMAAERALRQLLMGTDLRFEFLDDRTVGITSDAPRANATQPAAAVASAGAAATAEEEEPKAGPPDAAPAEAAPLEEVIITGSNIRRSGVQIDRAAIPIETVSVEEFRSASGESIAAYLQSRPMFTGTNGNPSNDYYGGGESTLNLRGLGSQYTLVLINGRRAAGEDGVADVGSIPEEAIESVEILKSGSSAIYGANAVGGVVNIKLRRQFEGVEFSTSYGNTTRHDAAYKRAAMLFGAGAGRARVVGSLGWQDRNGIEPGDRPLTSTADWRAWGGLDTRNSFYFLPQFITGLGPERYALDISRFSPGQSSMDPDDFVAAPIEQSFNRFDTGHLPQNSRFGGHWNAEFDLLEDRRAVLFTEGYYDRRKQLFHPLGLPIIGGPRFTRLVVPADNPFNPFGQEVQVGYFVGPNEYSRRMENRFRTDALLGTAGIHGDVGRFSYEVSYSSFEQKRVRVEANDFHPALAQAAIDNGTLNVFGYWANPPELIASLVAPPRTTTVENTTDAITAKLTGVLFELPAGATRFAAGVERRDVGFEESYDVFKQSISTFWSGARTQWDKFERKVDAYFGELSVPVYRRGAGSFLSSVEASLAMRRESYDDFGDTNVPQGALRFGFLEDSLILRASYAEGFRAPSLEELTPFEGLVSTAGIYDPYFDDFVEVFYRTGGNPDLEAEVGVTRNVGLVFTPRGKPNLTLRADWWQVKQRNTIETPTFTEVLLGRQPGTVTRDPVTGIATVDARYSNTGDRVIEGLDIGARYRTQPSRFGTLTFDFSTSLLTKVEHTFGTTTVDGLGYYTGLFGAMPRSRSVLGTSWQYGNWEASSFLRYEPGVNETEVVVRRTDDYATADLQVAYDFGSSSAGLGGLLKDARVYAGIENLWDETLPFFASTWIGWSGSLHDLRGRYYYAGLRKKF